MRITGGKDKGKIIKVPKGIRPTQDKIRAIVFDVIENKVEPPLQDFANTRFIDLFAGSGSVGIEALSRGAKEAIFVENSKKVIQTLKDNLDSLGYSERANIIPTDAIKVLNLSIFQSSDLLTIIFADPPYNKGYVEKIIQLIVGTISNRAPLPLQSKNSYRGSRGFRGEGVSPLPLIIIEHSKHEPISTGRHYKSGDSIITFILEEG